MKFNLCIIQPEGYIHSLAFLELAELLVYSLRDLNHEALLQFNKIDNASKNILIGFHLLDIKYLDQIPKDTILINAEQFSGGTPWNENILKWIKSFEVWDYSQQNIDVFKGMGLSNIHLLKLGYQKELDRIQKIPAQDIDILFYGSINPRRAHVLDNLKNFGLNTHTSFGVYGKDRDDLIGRSKIVLNLHYYKSEIFEVVRVFYLLSNAVAVVGEINPTTTVDNLYRNAVVGVDYENLVSACLNLINNDQLRIQNSKNGFETIRQYPQKFYTAELL